MGGRARGPRRRRGGDPLRDLRHMYGRPIPTRPLMAGSFLGQGSPPAVPSCCQTYWDTHDNKWNVNCYATDPATSISQGYQGGIRFLQVDFWTRLCATAAGAAPPSAAPPTPAPAPVVSPPPPSTVPAPVSAASPLPSTGPIPTQPVMQPQALPPAGVITAQPIMQPQALPPVQPVANLPPGGYVAPPPMPVVPPAPAYAPGQPIPIADWFGLCRRNNPRR